MAKKTKHEEDLDRTDELPQLNVAAYEASLRHHGEDETLSRTDNWVIPAQSELQAARISQLEADLQERESALDTLRDNLEKTASSESQLAGELNGILERISHLEMRLSESESLNSSLTERSNVADNARAAAEARAAAVESSKQKLIEEHNRAVAGHKERERRAEQDIAGLRSQAFEQAKQHQEELARAATAQQSLQQRVDREKSVAADHLQEIETLRGAVTAEQRKSQTLQATIGQLEQQIEKQNAATQALAQNFASQLAHSEEADQLLIRRDERIRQLEIGLRSTTEKLEFFETAASDVGEQARDLQGQLAINVQRLAERESEIQARDRRIADLSAQLEQGTRELHSLTVTHTDLTKTLLHERSELEQIRANLTEKEAALTKLEHELQGVNQSAQRLQTDLDARQQDVQRLEQGLQSLEQERNELRHSVEVNKQDHDAAEQRIERLETENKEREQTVQTQMQEIEEWQRVWREATPRLTAAEAAAAEQAQHVQRLEIELQNALREGSDQKAAAEQARALSEAVAGKLALKDKRIAALEVELAAHIKALGAIGRGIKRAGAETPVESTGVRVRSLVAVDDEQVVHLLNRSIMIIGRAEDCDIQIDSKKISRKHACLRVASTAVIIEDMGSTNGVFVNGRRTKKQLLHDGDEVLVGDVRFRLSSRLSNRTQ